MSDYTPIEVEVKIPIEDFESVYLRLGEAGFVHTRTRKEEDVYFNSLYYDLKERDKALRIRRTIDLETKCLVTLFQVIIEAVKINILFFSGSRMNKSRFSQS